MLNWDISLLEWHPYTENTLPKTLRMKRLSLKKNSDCCSFFLHSIEIQILIVYHFFCRLLSKRSWWCCFQSDAPHILSNICLTLLCIMFCVGMHFHIITDDGKTCSVSHLFSHPMFQWNNLFHILVLSLSYFSTL